MKGVQKIRYLTRIRRADKSANIGEAAFRGFPFTGNIVKLMGKRWRVENADHTLRAVELMPA